ncbi:MAG TPA: serine/threonine protein kinase, partial [Clostridiales bacterium UBA8960]|nr:serine/threonine protein kinase [Clostridiales bacterium UBA8960]
MTQLIGNTLGNRYEIVEIVGVGGMAVVYRGRDNVLNRMVAVKVLKQEFNADEEFVKKFQKESQAAASLSHPNIVNVFDVGHSDDVHYIVMELVNGNTLRDYLNKMQGFMKEEAIINIGLQIASALSQAHQNDIVHRDIKSQNILINENGSVKVADFGIARAATSA